MSETATQPKRQTVDAHKGWLVQAGDRIGEMAKRNRDWKHQIRTVWEAARTENEPLVVLNFLRYQAARNSGNWRQPADVYEDLSQLMEKCRAEAKGDSELAMDLICHLLAYTYRAFTFHEEEEKRRRQQEEGR